MARYIISHRMAGRRLPDEIKASRDTVEMALKQLGVEPLYEIGRGDEEWLRKTPLARRSVEIEIDEGKVDRMRSELPADVIIEPVIKMKFHGNTGISTAPPLASTGIIEVQILGAGMPLEGAQASYVFVENGKLKKSDPVRTGVDGKAVLTHPSSVQPLFVLGEPAATFWAMFTDQPAPSVVLDCPPLPATGPVEWWHEAMGAGAFDPKRGEGIRIGAPGSGVGPHPGLAHVQRIDGKVDLLAHETHVCGIMGALPLNKGDFGGIAPGAQIFSARIAELNSAGQVEMRDQAFIALTIQVLADPDIGLGVDLINVSFGDTTPSEILHDAISYARDVGTVCICSAGNDFRGPIQYPAAFDEAVAVTALGLKDWAPPRSISSFYVPNDPADFGSYNLFFPKFSNLGPKAFCTAPGTGIISTVPEWFGLTVPFAVMDGTSLASPAVCAILAAVLAENPEYLAMPRNRARGDKAIEILESCCIDVGLRADAQGHGLPRVHCITQGLGISSFSRKKENCMEEQTDNQQLRTALERFLYHAMSDLEFRRLAATDPMKALRMIKIEPQPRLLDAIKKTAEATKALESAFGVPDFNTTS